MALFNTFKNDCAGNVGMMFVAMAIPLMLGVGISVDTAAVFKAETRLQSAIDATVLASAMQTDVTNTELQTYAEAIFLDNIDKGDASQYSVTMTESSDGVIDGSATTAHNLIFGSMIGMKSKGLYVTAQALRPMASAATDIEDDGACIMSLSQNAWDAVIFNSGADIIAPSCEMHIHTTQSRAMSVNNGTTLDLHRICLASCGYTNNGSALNNVETNCAVESDPYAGDFPEPDMACDYVNDIHINTGGTHTLSPGVYCANVNVNNANATLELEPGTYVIKNRSFSVNGATLIGDGVTFYLTHDNSRLVLNSQSNVQLTAPSTGDYAGVLITEKAGLNSADFNLNDNSGTSLNGIVYLPSKRVTFNSGANVESHRLKLVADTFIFNQVTLDLENITTTETTDSSDDVSEFVMLTK